MHWFAMGYTKHMTTTTPRYNRTTDNGETMSLVPGWEVTYPARCNGHLGDLGFVASRGLGGSGFVHFDAQGRPYGMPLTVATRNRLLALRRDNPDNANRTDVIRN